MTKGNAKFWQLVSEFKHPLLEPLRAQVAQIDSQMIDLQKNIKKASTSKKPTDTLKTQKPEMWKQLDYLYDQIVSIVARDSSPDTASQIWQQQQQIAHQRAKMTEATLSENTAPAPATAPRTSLGLKDAAAHSSIKGGPKVGRFSADSIKAVETMRSTLDANMKADPTAALIADEQHLLMLRFNLDTHDYVMQSHTWMDVESKGCNWHGLTEKDSRLLKLCSLRTNQVSCLLSDMINCWLFATCFACTAALFP